MLVTRRYICQTMAAYKLGFAIHLLLLVKAYCEMKDDMYCFCLLSCCLHAVICCVLFGAAALRKTD